MNNTTFILVIETKMINEIDRIIAIILTSYRPKNLLHARPYGLGISISFHSQKVTKIVQTFRDLLSSKALVLG